MEAKRHQPERKVERRKGEKKRLEDVDRKLREIEKKLKEEKEIKRREREENQEQEQEERQGALIEQTTPIQVEKSKEPEDEEEGEQVQVQELAQQIEHMVEETGMDLEQEPQDQDTNLMLRASEVVPQSLLPPKSKPVQKEKGEVVLLDDDLKMDVYNLSFDEPQKRIVQT